MTNKEQLREEFEKTKGSASWISADIYPNERVFTNDYVEFLESEIEKREERIKELEEVFDLGETRILELEGKIKEAESGRETAP